MRRALKKLTAAAAARSMPISPQEVHGELGHGASLAGVRTTLSRLVKSGSWGVCGRYYPIENTAGAILVPFLVTQFEREAIEAARGEAAAATLEVSSAVERGYWYCDELAGAANIERGTVARWIRESRIDAIKVEGEWRIPPGAAAAFFAEVKAGATPAVRL